MNIAHEKQKAREFLRGRYKETALAVVVYILVKGVCIALHGIYVYTCGDDASEILNFFVNSLPNLIIPIFHFALVKAVIDMTRSSEPVSFKTYKANLNYGKLALGNYWWNTLWVLIWFLSIGASCLIISKIIKYIIDVVPGQAGAVFGIILMLLIISFGIFLIIILISKPLSYCFDILILAENPENGVIKSLKDSVKLTEDDVYNLFLFNLSFIGWNILEFVTLGIACIWVRPYYILSKYNFYRSIAEKKLYYLHN
ncbi:MAG: DUF975 family protein [Treponema sp.]|nr:DUF975 family protein [Treponema sp.]